LPLTPQTGQNTSSGRLEPCLTVFVEGEGRRRLVDGRRPGGWAETTGCRPLPGQGVFVISPPQGLQERLLVEDRDGLVDTGGHPEQVSNRGLGEPNVFLEVLHEEPKVLSG
jgi:hypothetical protein